MKAIRLKKITYALCLALMASVLVSNRCVAQFSIPDPNFKAHLQKTIPKAFDASGNLITTSQEVTSLEGIDVSEKEIKSLDGIQFFTGLKKLVCFRNQLTSLDVSKNTELTKLWCSINKLNSLDVSKNIALLDLACSSNQLTSLDVSKNTALEFLFCSHNQLTSLDISKNIALTDLNCFDNQLTSLDVSKNIALERLDCSGNQLTSLDVSKNITLEKLFCDFNQLTSLDVSKNIALERLDCNKNQLTYLDIRGIRSDYYIVIESERGSTNDIVCYDYSPYNLMSNRILENPLKKILIHTNIKDVRRFKEAKTERGDALIISTYSAEEGSSNYTLKCANYNPNTGVCK